MIIFLDFDGVLNTDESQKKWNVFSTIPEEIILDKNCVNAFNKLCLNFKDIKIVVSSTWRKEFSIEGLNTILERHEIYYKVISVTNSRFDNVRGREIKDWLENNNNDNSLFVIIDDNIHDIIDFFDNNKIIYCSWKDGLTEELVKKWLE